MRSNLPNEPEDKAALRLQQFESARLPIEEQEDQKAPKKAKSKKAAKKPKQPKKKEE